MIMLPLYWITFSSNVDGLAFSGIVFCSMKEGECIHCYTLQFSGWCYPLLHEHNISNYDNLNNTRLFFHHYKFLFHFLYNGIPYCPTVEDCLSCSIQIEAYPEGNLKSKEKKILLKKKQTFLGFISNSQFWMSFEYKFSGGKWLCCPL